MPVIVVWNVTEGRQSKHGSKSAAAAVTQGKQKGGQLQAGMGGRARMLAGQAVGSGCISTNTSTCHHSSHTQRTPLVPMPLLLAAAAAPAAVAAAAAAPLPLPLLSCPLLLLSQLLTADSHGFVGRQQAHAGAVCRRGVLRTEQVGSWAGGSLFHTLHRDSLGRARLAGPHLSAPQNAFNPSSTQSAHQACGLRRQQGDA